MALELYNKKRNFGLTPEPKGRVVKRKGKGLMFVIQKHRASHLHYDFRLELNGVLLSWAVPKGPSLDTSVRRLAMHVEDHPIEYGDFEGTIPPKQYGAGTVLLWDRGVWIPRGDPVDDYKKGRLKFDLEGEKLGGGWMLVRGGANGKYGENAWFLIKEKDEYAKPESAGSIVEQAANSVASGRSLEEIAADPHRVWHSNKSVAENVKRGAVRKAKPTLEVGKLTDSVKAMLPKMIAPELATLVKQSPPGDEWVHEMKLDGYRMVCRIEAGHAQMFSRNDKEWTDNFPGITKCLARLPVDSAWIDGEVVVMQPDGRTSFQALQNALSGEEASTLHYFAFDLMYVNGYDLRRVALIDRKRTLESLLAGAPDTLRFSSHMQGSGAQFFEQACKLKLEGVIAKRGQSTYQSGRTRDWFKVKCGMRQEMVIGGYTDPGGSRSGFGALLLGVYEPDGTLRYSGKVGTGFNDVTLKILHKQLVALEIKTAPFSNPPRGYEAKGAHWVKPDLVAEVEFTEWTNEGTLRHPSFQGLRADKQAKDVVRERPATTDSDKKIEAPREEGEAKVKTRAKTAKRATRTAKRSEESAPNAGTVAGVKLSNPDKVLYPEAGLTKCDLARFYENIGEWILPHVRNRPLTLVRCPNGWNKQCFYQKHPDAKVNPIIERVTVDESSGPTLYMLANSVPAIVALLQMGALELHPFGSSAPKLGCPDRIIFDFDPDDSISWERLVEAVHLLKTLLEELGLKPYIKTTGGKGMHVVIPIKPDFGWHEIKPFTKAIAELLEHSFPDRFVSNMSKAKRRGKIFVDYLRNGEGATAIAPYSLRARGGAPVATPIAWEELAQDLRRDHFNARNVPERLQRMKRDPWADFFTVKQSVTRAMMKKVGVK